MRRKGHFSSFHHTLPRGMNDVSHTNSDRTHLLAQTTLGTGVNHRIGTSVS